MSPLSSLVRFALARPRLILAAFLCLIPLGFLALRDQRVELTPNLAPAEFRIDAEATGLDAQQVEQTVTRPIETAVLGAAGVQHVRSKSLQGLSLVIGEFAEGADQSRVRQALQERLASLRDLPASVPAPVLEPPAAADADVLEVGFTSDKLDPMALRDLVQWTIRPRLLAVSGVAQIRLYGGQVRRLEVRARPGDLADSDLGFLDIIAAVRRATGVAGAGFIDTPSQRVPIEPHGQAETADEVGAGQIQTSGNAPVRIADVADVTEAPAPVVSDAAVDGKPAVVLVVERLPEANAIETTRTVEQALQQMQPLLAGQGVTARTDLDRPADFTLSVMKGLMWDLLIGLALVAVALLLILREPRSVLLALVTIPATFAVSLIALKLLGWSVNAMTLGGLVVALGLVIDDAVIDIEDIAARLRDAEAHHRGREEALLAASREVREPLVYGALAMEAALAPLLWAGGPTGTLLAPLAGAIMTAIAASLLVTLTLTPALAAVLIKGGGAKPTPRAVHRLRDRLLRRLPGFAERPIIALVAGVACLAILVGLALSFRAEFLPGLHDEHLVVRLRTAGGISPDAAADLDRRIAADLKAETGIRAVTETLGRSLFGGDAAGLDEARFDLDLTPKLSASAQRDLAQRLRRRLESLPGVEPTVASRFEASQLFQGADAPLQVVLFGRDPQVLDQAAGQVGDMLKRQSAVASISPSASVDLPTVRADLDFNRLAIFGLSAADVLDTVQAAFAGETLARIYQGDRAEDLAITAQADLRRDPEAIGRLLLRSTSGFAVPLKSVAKVYLTDEPAEIAHEAGQRVAVVGAEAKPGLLDRLAAETRAAMAQTALPAGVYSELRVKDSAETLWRPLRLAYGLGAVLLIGFLTIAFDVRTASLAIVAAAFSWVGCALAIAALGGVVTVGTTAGLAAAYGFGLRGAILLLSRMEDRVRQGGATWSTAAVDHATRERAVPLVVATLLLILALAPLALSLNSPGHEILAPMAVVIIAGAIAGTLGNLALLPILAWRFWRPQPAPPQASNGD
ncbi:efflux RND transporter permease subunit [Phenylobacterium montanum]|uniref:Efflux RND transporter permease subunit n=1 Tax=Phenylobacterium montanum TaxID=2823693 RepID=A0A975ISS1_9CAUL|nr:efflux RND transporter permease subunit [Caulobacter sp. S6]QUD85980.1 efflux RND transporter permease subunit [Caulobacter sp. S6]